MNESTFAAVHALFDLFFYFLVSIPSFHKSFSNVIFFLFSTKLWNNLLYLTLYLTLEADTLCQFKSRLKTHFFNLAYT